MTPWDLAKRLNITPAEARYWYDASTNGEACLAYDARMVFGSDDAADIADRLSLGYTTEQLAAQFDPELVDAVYTAWRRQGCRTWPPNSAQRTLARVIPFPANTPGPQGTEH